MSYDYSGINDVLVTAGPAPTGENTKRRQFEYDGAGRLTSVCELTTGTGSGSCGQSHTQTGYWTKYTYDVLGALLTVAQNAQSGTSQNRTYTYDGLGRLTSESNPETGTTSYVYDSIASGNCAGTFNGNLIKRTDQVGNITCYTYDALHRVKDITYPAGSYASSTAQKHFVYDTATVNGIAMVNAKGRLAEAYTGTSGSKTTDLGFSYTARGEVSETYESTPHSGGFYHLTGAYWPHGLLQSLTGLPGLPTLYYGASDGTGLDGEGRYTKVNASSGQNPVTGVTYTASGTTQPIGSLTQATLGSADYDTFSYDVNTGRMTQYQFNVASPLKTDTGVLTWNPNGTLKQLAITDQLNSSNTQTCTYGYDDLSRVTSANCGTPWNQSFSFDPFGNVTKTGSISWACLTCYDTTKNRYNSTLSPSISYDANGNLTNDTFHTYTWDAEGESLSIDTVNITYDALGRMVEQNRSGTYTEIVYTPGGAKLALMTGQTLQKGFVPLPGGGTAVYNPSGLVYYRHPDLLGSSRLATTPTRTCYWDTAYAPFGENYASPASGCTTQELSFTGQNQDTVSGMYDFLYREYHPNQGRWISPDPAGPAAVAPSNPQSWNRYAYVVNDPTGLIDPLGLCPIPGVWQDHTHSHGCENVPTLHQFNTIYSLRYVGYLAGDDNFVWIYMSDPVGTTMTTIAAVPDNDGTNNCKPGTQGCSNVPTEQERAQLGCTGDAIANSVDHATNTFGKQFFTSMAWGMSTPVIVGCRLGLAGCIAGADTALAALPLIAVGSAAKGSFYAFSEAFTDPTHLAGKCGGNVGGGG